MTIPTLSTNRRRIAAAAATLLVGAATTVSAGEASARPIQPGDHVNYTWCGGGIVKLWYFDASGDVQEEFVNMRGGCREYSYRAASRSAYVASFITDNKGGRVMCTIRVNSRLISRKIVEADGIYTYAHCN